MENMNVSIIRGCGCNLAQFKREQHENGCHHRDRDKVVSRPCLRNIGLSWPKHNEQSQHADLTGRNHQLQNRAVEDEPQHCGLPFAAVEQIDWSAYDETQRFFKACQTISPTFVQAEFAVPRCC